MFKLRTEYSVSQLRIMPLRLVERHSTSFIHGVERVPYLEGSERIIDTPQNLQRHDPTMIDSVEQLSGCQTIFDDFIKARGVDAFVRTAYVYVLGRPANQEETALYGQLLRQALLSSYIMIRTLAESTEFRSKTRFLVAPNMMGFPFRYD
jgi:hypothetical protein